MGRTTLIGGLLATVGLALVLGGPGCGKDDATDLTSALDDYKNKAKGTEASVGLKMIALGSEFYFSAPKVSAEGVPMPCAFPESSDWTPSAKGCCGELGGADADGDNMCDVDPAAWDAPTWKALSWRQEGTHYFRYKYESSGSGATAKFTATAIGDLDCDGVLSTFRLQGRASASSTGQECTAEIDPEPLRTNEGE